MDLPGVDPKEVDVSVSGDVITVKAERQQKEEKKEGEHYHEEISYEPRAQPAPPRKDRRRQDQGVPQQGPSRDHYARAEGAPEEGLGQAEDTK